MAGLRAQFKDFNKIYPWQANLLQIFGDSHSAHYLRLPYLRINPIS